MHDCVQRSTSNMAEKASKTSICVCMCVSMPLKQASFSETFLCVYSFPWPDESWQQFSQALTFHIQNTHVFIFIQYIFHLCHIQNFFFVRCCCCRCHHHRLLIPLTIFANHFRCSGASGGVYREITSQTWTSPYSAGRKTEIIATCIEIFEEKKNI